MNERIKTICLILITIAILLSAFTYWSTAKIQRKYYKCQISDQCDSAGGLYEQMFPEDGHSELYKKMFPEDF